MAAAERIIRTVSGRVPVSPTFDRRLCTAENWGHRVPPDHPKESRCTTAPCSIVAYRTVQGL